MHDGDCVRDDREVVDLAAQKLKREFVDGGGRVKEDDVALFHHVQRLVRHRDLLGAVCHDAVLVGGGEVVGVGRVAVDESAADAFDGIALCEHCYIAVDRCGAYAEAVHELLERAGAPLFEQGENLADAYVVHAGHFTKGVLSYQVLSCFLKTYPTSLMAIML